MAAKLVTCYSMEVKILCLTISIIHETMFGYTRHTFMMDLLKTNVYFIDTVFSFRIVYDVSKNCVVIAVCGFELS